MIYKVITYDSIRGCHMCLGEYGGVYAIDLSTSATFPFYDGLQTNDEYQNRDIELIGKTIEIKKVLPYIEIGYNISIVE